MTDRTRLGTLDVPRAAIGTINWVPDDGGPSDARLLATFAEASRVGLNFFDTAERYGASPLSMVGQAARALGRPSARRLGRGAARLVCARRATVRFRDQVYASAVACVGRRGG